MFSVGGVRVPVELFVHTSDKHVRVARHMISATRLIVRRSLFAIRRLGSFCAKRKIGRIYLHNCWSVRVSSAFGSLRYVEMVK